MHAADLHSSSLQTDLISFFDGVGPFVFYAVVFLLVFAGTALFVGVFVPFVTGDSLLFAAGLTAAAHPELNIVVLTFGVGCSAFLGDQVGYLIGRHAGRDYFDKRKSERFQRAIRASEKFYAKYGWWSVVVARFVPLGRVVIPAIAGISRMNYYRFLSSNFVGAILWGVGLTLTGFFAASIPGVKNVAYIIAVVVIIISVVAGIRTWRDDRSASSSVFDSDDEPLVPPSDMAVD